MNPSLRHSFLLSRSGPFKVRWTTGSVTLKGRAVDLHSHSCFLISLTPCNSAKAFHHEAFPRGRGCNLHWLRQLTATMANKRKQRQAAERLLKKLPFSQKRCRCGIHEGVAKEKRKNKHFTENLKARRIKCGAL